MRHNEIPVTYSTVVTFPPRRMDVLQSLCQATEGFLFDFHWHLELASYKGSSEIRRPEDIFGAVSNHLNPACRMWTTAIEC